MRAVSANWPAKRWKKKIKEVVRTEARFQEAFDSIIGSTDGIIYKKLNVAKAEEIGMPHIDESARQVMRDFVRSKLPVLAKGMDPHNDKEFEVTEEAIQQAAWYMIKEFAVFHAVPEAIGFPNSKMTIVYHTELIDNDVFRHFVETHENTTYWPLNDPGTSRRVERVISRVRTRRMAKKSQRHQRQAQANENENNTDPNPNDENET